MTRKEINIARIIYDAYPCSDLLPIDPEKDCKSLDALLAKVTSENIGDSHFRFIVVEIIEGGENTMEGAIRVMKRAMQDVEAVLEGLQKAESCRLCKKAGCNSQSYCEAAEYLAEQGRQIFTGPMAGGLWNARCMDAARLSRKQDDKAAYEFLLRFGNQYAGQLPESQKLLWGEFKNKAAAIACPILAKAKTDAVARREGAIKP